MDLTDIKKCYEESHRFHHTWKHVEYIINEMMHWLDDHNCHTKENENIVTYATIFHDAIYNPKANDNEEKSSELWLKYAHEINITEYMTNKVASIILSTKHPEKCTDEFEKAFNRFDWMNMGIIISITKEYAKRLHEYENNIFKEYQFVNVETYVEKRLEFLKDSYYKGLLTEEVFKYLSAIVNRKYTVGYYAGSFNPFHIGHMNVLKKAEKMFDKVVVAQGINPEKTQMFNTTTQVLLKDTLNYHEIDSYENQLVDFINSKRTEHCNPVLVRGLRNGYDLNAESNLISFVNEQADARNIERIPVVYISCDKEFEHVSSSFIKMLPEEDRKRYIPNKEN